MVITYALGTHKWQGNSSSNSVSMMWHQGLIMLYLPSPTANVMFSSVLVCLSCYLSVCLSVYISLCSPIFLLQEKCRNGISWNFHERSNMTQGIIATILRVIPGSVHVHYTLYKKEKLSLPTLRGMNCHQQNRYSGINPNSIWISHGSYIP